jgi:thiamine transport system permease protein
MLVFSLCFTSFAVVLALGGGPAATVLEVAIYQALRLDLALGRAGLLALVQLGICAIMAALLLGLGRPVALTASLGRPHPRPDTAGALGRAGDALAIAAAAVFVLAPLAAMVARGLGGPMSTVLTDADVLGAASRSLAVGIAAGSLAVGLAWCLATAARASSGRAVGRTLDLVAMLPLATSPLAMGAGLFALLHDVVPVFGAAIPLVVLVNAFFVLPYAARLIAPAAREAADRYGRLCASLGIAGWDRLRLVDWPIVRAPAGLALALGAALSAGDLGAIALFGTQDSATLPLLLYQRMAAYRMDEAAVIAVLLVALALGLFAALERLVGGRRRD